MERVKSETILAASEGTQRDRKQALVVGGPLTPP